MGIEDYLFMGLIIVYVIGFVLSYYLHKLYWRKRHSDMGPISRSVYVGLTTVAGIIFFVLLYTVFKTNTISRYEVIIRMIQMFLANAIFFSMVYFILYISGKHEFGRSDHDTKTAQTLYGKYFQMIYLSVITFFTVGFSDLMPFGLASRIANTMQIVLADIIAMFLYSRSKYVFKPFKLHL